MSKIAVWRSYGASPPGLRAYVAARLANAPLAAVRGDLEALRGRILSLGAGAGVVERYLTQVNAGVEVLGLERDAARVRAAGAAERVEVRVGDVLDDLPDGPFEGALAFDLLHHLSFDGQEALARSLHAALAPGATVLVKDIATTPRWKHAFNAGHDRLVAGERVQCRAPEDMAEVFAAAGFTVSDVRRVSPRSPYPHYLVRLTR